MSKQKIDDLWGRYCCDCLEEIYQIKLSRKDCYFSRLIMGNCCKCGEVHHFVMGVRFPASVRLQYAMLFKNEGKDSL